MTTGRVHMMTAREAGLLACTSCARVWPRTQTRCGRCGAALQSRDQRSLSRVWAWWIVGLMAYIPANLYPMLTTTTLVTTSEDTIVGGAIELIHHDAVGVALIILIASVLIPVAKFICIAYLALSVRQMAPTTAGARFIMYELVEYIGRWSMIDVFVVAILSSLVQLSVAASINPGIASLSFAISVVATMLSAQAFDSRMIWDRIDPEEPVERSGVAA